MASTIKLRRSAVAGKVPAVGDLQLGELALNTYDGKLYTKKDNGTASIVEIGSGGSGTPVTTSDTAPGSPVDGDLWYDSIGGRTYVYYDDGSSSQWVDASPQGIGGGGGGGGQDFTFSPTAPSSPNVGDEWLDSTSGILYTRVDDGNSSAWVELAPPQLLAPEPKTNLDGGTPTTNYGGVVAINAGGVT